MPAHDVLIIGAGLAGQRAALAAAEAGASVAIMSKVHPVRSHSVAAAGGINAAINPADADYLYFVSRNDGSHEFARTLDEHNRNVQKFQVQYFRDQKAGR